MILFIIKYTLPVAYFFFIIDFFNKTSDQIGG
jgi:hypothetical protein